MSFQKRGKTMINVSQGMGYKIGVFTMAFMKLENWLL